MGYIRTMIGAPANTHTANRPNRNSRQAGRLTQRATEADEKRGPRELFQWLALETTTTTTTITITWKPYHPLKVITSFLEMARAKYMIISIIGTRISTAAVLPLVRQQGRRTTLQSTQTHSHITSSQAD